MLQQLNKVVTIHSYDIANDDYLRMWERLMSIYGPTKLQEDDSAWITQTRGFFLALLTSLELPAGFENVPLEFPDDSPLARMVDALNGLQERGLAKPVNISRMLEELGTMLVITLSKQSRGQLKSVHHVATDFFYQIATSDWDPSLKMFILFRGLQAYRYMQLTWWNFVQGAAGSALT